MADAARSKRGYGQQQKGEKKGDPKINELIDWENKDQILNWLDSL